ncbi:hypothetical protein KI387_025257, partial [Taxus chinensis]
MPQRNVVSWNAMMAAYAQHGCEEKACDLLGKMPQKMWSSGTYPDHVSFIFVYLAFSQAGSMHEGCKYFDGMSASCRIMPRINHY